MTTLNPSQTENAPTLASIRALFAMLASLILKPDAENRITDLFAQLEATIASHLLWLAIQQANHPYRTADMYEARLIWRGAAPELDIRLRPGAIHPLHRIIAGRRRAGRIALIRRALGRRYRFSSKLRTVQMRTRARRASSAAARHDAGTRSPLHTPSRIPAPP